MERILVIRPNMQTFAYPRDRILALYNIDNATLDRLIETGEYLSKVQHICFDIA